MCFSGTEQPIRFEHVAAVVYVVVAVFGVSIVVVTALDCVASCCWCCYSICGFETL